MHFISFIVAASGMISLSQCAPGGGGGGGGGGGAGVQDRRPDNNGGTGGQVDPCVDGSCINAFRDHPFGAVAFCERILSLPQTVTNTLSTTSTQLFTSTITTLQSTTVTNTVTIPSTLTLLPIVNKRVGDDIAAGDLDSFGPFPPPFADACPRYQVRRICDCFLNQRRTPSITTSTIVAVSTASTFTSVSTTIVSTSTSTKSTYVPAATVMVGNCNIAYRLTSPVDTTGTTVVSLPSLNALDCCNQCKFKLNCIASAYGPGTFSDLFTIAAVGVDTLPCRHMIQVDQQLAAPTSDTCPLGVHNLPFGLPNPIGNVFAGPCGQ